jgi:hypothetical protein
MIAEWVTRGKNIPAFRWEYTRFIETDFTEDKKHIFVCPPQSVTSRRAELVQRLNIGAPLTIKSGNHLTLQTYSLPKTDFGKSLLASTIESYSDIRQAFCMLLPISFVPFAYASLRFSIVGVRHLLP